MLKFALVVAACYGLLVVVMSFMQSRMLYLPDVPGRALAMTPADVGMDYEDVSIGNRLACCCSFTAMQEISHIVWTQYGSSKTWVYQY